MMKEKKLLNSDPVSISGTKKILDQMMNSICKIKMKGKSGTGFFCKISFEGYNINVLMTNHHILDQKYYDENKELRLLLNDEKDAKIIDLTKKRKTYFNEEYDIALIELKSNDNINNYIELDDNLFKNELKAYYEDKSIYVLQYPSNNISVSYGLLTQINNYNIIHTCSTEKGSSGSPILNLNNFKVIGIHKEASIHFNFNKGTLLKFPLNDFITKNKNIFINNIMKNNINQDIMTKNKNHIMLDNQDKTIINFENNIIMKSYQKYMMIGYYAEMISTYIDMMIDDDMIEHFISHLKERIYKWVHIQRLRELFHDNLGFYFVDFTNDKDLGKKTVKFYHDCGRDWRLVLSYGTTIDEMLKKFLFVVNRENLYGSNEFGFLFNGIQIRFGDQNLIEKEFENYDFPTILLFDQGKIIPLLDFED